MNKFGRSILGFLMVIAVGFCVLEFARPDVPLEPPSASELRFSEGSDLASLSVADASDQERLPAALIDSTDFSAQRLEWRTTPDTPLDAKHFPEPHTGGIPEPPKCS